MTRASLYKGKQFIGNYSNWESLEADARWLYAKNNNMINWPYFGRPCLPKGYLAVLIYEGPKATPPPSPISINQRIKA